MASEADVSWQEAVAKQARVLQMIVAALVLGSLFFLLIALNIGRLGNQPGSLPISLTLIAWGLAGIELIVQAVVASGIARKARREIIDGTYEPVHAREAGGQATDAANLLPFFQNKTIISGAIFEGVAFFSTTAYLIEGNSYALVLAVLMIVGVASQFPTQSRIIGWVERQFEAMEREKMLR